MKCGEGITVIIKERERERERKLEREKKGEKKERKVVLGRDRRIDNGQ